MYPVLVLIPIAVTVALVTYVVRTSLKDGTGVPWIGAIVVALLSWNILGGIIALAVWKNDHEEKVIRRKVQRDAFEASRVQPYRSTSGAPTRQSVAPVAPMLLTQSHVTSRLANTNGVDMDDRAEQARVADGIVDTILDLYPDHPHSERIRAGRNGHPTN